jgi:hypothetical protein
MAIPLILASTGVIGLLPSVAQMEEWSSPIAGLMKARQWRISSRCG